jgi:NDP-sugar pyrophosphorylase family protein
MDGRYRTAPFAALPPSAPHIGIDVRVEDGAVIEGPCFLDDGVLVKTGARIGRYSVIGRQCQIEEDARIDGAIVWQNTRVARDASLRDAIVGRNCHIGRSVSVDGGAILGDKSALTDYTRT